MPDEIFAYPRLAAIYDEIDGDRSDLDLYEAILTELGAQSVVDIGCGTGVLGCRLAQRGLIVVGVDPAQASIAVARAKPAAGGISWPVGDATTLPPMVVDAATMTGNVAQVFVLDEEWHAALAGINRCLREGGHLVFETRDPSFRAWEDWTRDRSRSRSLCDTVAGTVEQWVELTNVALPLVSFRHTLVFVDDGEVLSSDSTL